MPKDTSGSTKEITLRERAERRLAERPSKEQPLDPDSLVEELQVHQIELEMQNEELRRAQLEIEKSRKRYFELYDLAPVGYLTLDDQGVISELNIAAARLLGTERKSLIDKPFNRFINAEFRRVFSLHLRAMLESSIKQTCELEIEKKTGALFHARLDSVGTEVKGQRVMWTVLTDITERKRSETALKETKEQLEFKSSYLEEANAALKVLLRQREEDKKELENRVLANVEELVQPYIERLKGCHLSDSSTAYLEMLEANLDDIVSPFLKEMPLTHARLTPTETRVADLIRNGKSSKEIATLLNVSRRTIDAHRENIRSKLGLDKTKTNLQSFLRSIS